MNMNKRYRDCGETVAERMVFAPNEMNGDTCGIWKIISVGRYGFAFSGADLREFVYLYVKRLIEAGGVVIDGARDPRLVWEKVDRYGTAPEEIARNIVAEWVARGEPDIESYEDIAFTLPDYLASEDNVRLAYRK